MQRAVRVVQHEQACPIEQEGGVSYILNSPLLFFFFFFSSFDGDECKTEGCRIGRGCGFLQNYHRKFHASVCRCLIVLRCGGVAEWGSSRKPSYQCRPGACNRVPAIGARGSLLPLCTCNFDIRSCFFGGVEVYCTGLVGLRVSQSVCTFVFG